MLKKQNKGKPNRLQLMVSDQFNQEAQRLADELRKTKSSFIHDIVLKVALSQNQFFACCPTCDQALFDPDEVPITGGVQKQTCKQGHESYYDFAQTCFITLDTNCLKCKHCQGIQSLFSREQFCQHCDEEDWEIKNTSDEDVIFNPAGVIIA